MNAAPAFVPNTTSLHAALQRSLRRVAPAWPLQRWIAVNPWWGFTDQPLPQAARLLAACNGTQATMPLAWYQSELARGRINAAALNTAQAEAAQRLVLTPPSKAEWEIQPPSVWLSRHVPAANAAAHCLRDDISQHCTEVLGSLDTTDSQAGVALYESWRLREHALPAPLPAFQTLAAWRHLQRFPERADAAIAQCCEQLALPPEALEGLMTTLLLALPGWAGHLRYRHWSAEQEGRYDDSLEQLLAILLGWEVLLLDYGMSPEQRQRWHQERAAATPADQAANGGSAQPDLWVWQAAYEDSWRAGIHQALCQDAPLPGNGAAPRLQAVFCIDVRSEPMRRALEAQSSDIETHGYAGFFGLPIAVREPGLSQAQAQLPGLLSPSLGVQWQTVDARQTQPLAERRQRRLRLQSAWHNWRRSGTGGFGWVETLGLGYAVQLVRRSWPQAANRSLAPAGITTTEAETLLPEWQALDPGALAERLATIVRGMGLGQRWAPWVLLVGHGSESCNNPHAASLHCGACGGHRGDTHARLLARTLNLADVRAAMREHGVEIPATTRFVAALHNTVTDDLHLFEHTNSPDEPPLPAAQKQWLRQASAACRAERAPRLGLKHLTPAALHTRLLRRARDWAETRPEWGLAGNAGFIVAPRARTRLLNLQGRCFLHDYHWRDDDEAGSKLAAILTAPMVVAHWINLQYYAATTDPKRWGGGDKTLHNLLANGMGVIEGAAGDLKTGLPWQSVHDGMSLQHEPMRLAVWVEAPPERLAAVMQQHAVVRQLVAGDWVALFALPPSPAAAGPQRAHWQAGQLHWRPVAPFHAERNTP